SFSLLFKHPTPHSIYTLSLHDALPIFEDLFLADQLRIQQPQRTATVQPVDQVLDVLRRIARPRQAGDRIFQLAPVDDDRGRHREDRKSTRLNSSHVKISYAVFCLKKKK